MQILWGTTVLCAVSSGELSRVFNFRLMLSAWKDLVAMLDQGRRAVRIMVEHLGN